MPLWVRILRITAVPHDADEACERHRDHLRDLKGNHDLLSLTQPDVVESMHRTYLEAGAHLVGTDAVYGPSRVVVDKGTLHKDLEAAAISAVLRWVYKPATENGVPVEHRVTGYAPGRTRPERLCPQKNG